MDKHVVIGILAHVDAGKTTLSEALLYTTGGIRKLGRVDHQDAFLDTFSMERARGITIFSKQAELNTDLIHMTLLDTPGHVDFSAEMERTLQVLDYAILVISGADGVQAHTRTLWKLLKQYQIPVFLFVNKMDQPGTDREQLLAELQGQLSENCYDFSDVSAIGEDLAMCAEGLMEEYLETGRLSKESIRREIRNRRIIPCYFGSALKLSGIEALVEGLETYTRAPEYPKEFGAKVYKITRDENQTRLTHMKITGGSLKVKAMVGQEKADQIRIYSGTGYQAVSEVTAGQICAVTGLDDSYAGQGLGVDADSELPILEPVLNYQMILPEDCNPHEAVRQLRQLEEEHPLLHLNWQEETGELHVQVMGEVELEVLRALIGERFGLEVAFGTGSLVYKETIAGPVEGIGHFEPLRHYAEVHLLLEPGEPGSGIQVATACSEDMLDGHWQRLILSHLEERKHPGVLTGSEVTDIKITLIAGRAHAKHTEGGDFRQATYRAVRQGLRKAESILLEPYYEYRLEVPQELIGRALSDIQRMAGTFDTPEQEGDHAIITGTAPVATMSGYQSELNSYSRGMGRLSCLLKGYMPCHNQDEVLEELHYNPEEDVENPTGSVFCSHGAGFLVPWDQVEAYMHVESGWSLAVEKEEEQQVKPSRGVYASGEVADEDELEAIFRRTYGTSLRRPYANRYGTDADYEYNDTDRASGIGQTPDTSGWAKQNRKRKDVPRKERYLIVDGYNIIFAWEDLNELSKADLAAARGKLMDIMCNYQGYTGVNLILVYDGYKVPGNPGEMLEYHNIHVVYTKEAETADQYIEKLTHRMGGQYDITVATSDGLEQLIIWGAGAQRLSARGLREEVDRIEQEIREQYLSDPGVE